MTMFKRVRSAGPNDDKHEFDISVEQLEATPDDYIVVDDNAVSSFRAPKYVNKEAASGRRRKPAAPESEPEPVATPQDVESTPPGLTIPPKNGAGSGAPEWRSYAIAAAEAHDVTIDLPDDASRADVISTLQSLGIPTE